ncbi:PAS domain-containing sensor histidine kinase [Paraclostridium ghonii]|uniref:histidine kinase n=1 Tax=Paraclostridium ghonii TaxID=29358 RepID=A0ABU0N006_9FIRM|nr:HAMP domain-containing sensor histidine kinase [Paeniclostridium ghonii]MDQ0556193.1 signal transduction histidine kinase [Paeniclostridium ghonii]
MFNKNKKFEGSNKLATILTIGISACLVMFYIFSLVYIFKYNLILMIKPEDFIRIFNIVLALLATVSCLLCYNSTQKEELFIISLMYIIFAIDIILGVFDNLTLKNTIISMKGYIAISTSLMRISIILIVTLPLNKIRTFIVKYKLSSIVVVVLSATIFGYLEGKSVIFPIKKETNFFVLYNTMLIFIYSISSTILFKKSIKEKDYTYSVIGASILMLLVKAFYAIVGARMPIIEIKFISISITYMVFITLIVGLFLETIISIKRKRELEEEKKIFFNLVEENKASCIYISDMSGKVLYSNKKTRNYFFGNEDYKNTALTDRIEIAISSIDKDIVRNIENSVEEYGCWNGKVEVNYGKKIVDCSIQKIIDSSLKSKDEHGETEKLVVTFNDITEEHRMGKYISEYEKIKDHEKLKNEFFANISHELRTPLNIFYSTTQLLDMKLGSSDTDFRQTYSTYRQSLKTNCQRMLRLINNMVDITKIDVGYTKPNMKNCDIVRLIEEITMSVIIYAKQKDIHIVFDTEVEENIIKCDSEMIERAILNLLSNAIKFTNPNGNVFVNIHVNQEWVQIIVRDDGVGIPIHMQDLVFERFVQADKSLTRMNEGSGIGLSIVKAIVELNEGEIYLESDGKNGTEFEILLPNKKLLGDTIEDEVKDYKVDVQKIELELSDIYELY